MDVCGLDAHFVRQLTEIQAAVAMRLCSPFGGFPRWLPWHSCSFLISTLLKTTYQVTGRENDNDHCNFYSDATKLAELIRNREISPVEVMQAHLDRIEAVNPKINAIVSVAQGALEAAGRRKRPCWRARSSARCMAFRSR